jgi:hypothetical protein
VRGQDISGTPYGKPARVTVSERRCPWPRVYRSRPVSVIIVTEPDSLGLAPVTTDPGTPAA